MMSGLGNKKIMSKNLQHYLSLNNKTRQEVCNDLGFKYSTFTDWINGNTYPRIDKIEMLANYFGIEKSDLIEDYNKSQDYIYYLNSETREIAQEIFENKDMRILFDVARKTEPKHLKAYAEFLQNLQKEERND